MEQVINALFGVNAVLAFFGWLAYNVIMFSIYKDEDEERFNFKSYALKTYDNWIASLFVIPVLLLMGYLGLGIDIDGINKMEWKDCYYPLSGFITEAVKTFIKTSKK